MSTALESIEHQLVAVKDRFEAVLPIKTLPSERLIQTTLMALERNPWLLDRAPPQTILSACMSAAVLGLEPDGVMGQACLVPFMGKGSIKCQFLPMVGGYCSLADRAGRTLTGHVVFEGDKFEIDEAHGDVLHRFDPKSNRTDARRVIGAYAIARAVGKPDLIRWMGIDEILKVRDMSASYKKKPAASPWTSHPLAMFEKSPMRMLAKRLPVLPLHAANALETHFDLGRHTYMRDSGHIVIDGESEEVIDGAPDVSDLQPERFVYTALSGTQRTFNDAGKFAQAIVYVMERNSGSEHIETLMEKNKAEVERLPEREQRIVSDSYFIHGAQSDAG